MDKRLDETRVIESQVWSGWVEDLRSIAQVGLLYSSSVFDTERFSAIQNIAAQMASYGTNVSFEQVYDLFSVDEGYPTPKLLVRAAVFDEEGRILLVKERGNGWSLPGGWVEKDDSVGEAAVREVKEEAGLDVRAEFVIAVQDRDKHHEPYYSFKVCKVYVMCSLLGGVFEENIETVASGFFAREDVPELFELHTTREQVEMCFEAYSSACWEALLD